MVFPATEAATTAQVAGADVPEPLGWSRGKRLSHQWTQPPDRAPETLDALTSGLEWTMRIIDTGQAKHRRCPRPDELGPERFP